MRTLKISVRSISEPVDGRVAVKCPRCQRRHYVLDNFDNLCDRCCQTLATDFPNLDFIEEIKQSIAQQQIKYKK